MAITGPQFGQFLQTASPLLLAMGGSMAQGRPAQENVGQGLAAMMAMKKERDERDQRRRDTGLLADLMGGGMGYDATNAPSSQKVVRNAALSAFGGPTKGAAAASGGMFGSLEEQYGLPSGYLARTAQIESGGDPNAKNPNSSATGAFQFIDSTARQYGLTDPTDLGASADAAARLARDNAAALERVLGRKPNAAELYLAHQQGAGGAAKLLANPNARAVDVVGADAVRLNGGNANMTAGEFASKWLGKFGGGQQQPQQPQIDPGRLAQILQSPHISRENKQLLMQRYNAQTAQPDPITGRDRYMNVNGVLYDVTGDRPVPVTEAAADSGSEAEQEIARLEGIGIPRETAIRIKEGIYRLVTDPTTGLHTVVDMTTGQQVYQPDAGAQPGAEPPAAPPAPEADLGQQFPDAPSAFGLEGMARGGINAAADIVGMDAPFPETQQAQSDFGLLREQLINDIASGYDRQPPSWLLKNIEALTPRAGGLQGAGSAQTQLRSILRSLGSELNSVKQQMNRPMRETARQGLEAKAAGLESAVNRARSALQSFDAQPEQQVPGAPQVGVTEDGYRFLGGDPGNPENWQKVE